MVGTANSIVPPSAIAAQTGSGEKRGSSRSAPPTAQRPSTPEHEAVHVEERQRVHDTSPSVQPQAVASASRSNAAARCVRSRPSVGRSCRTCRGRAADRPGPGAGGRAPAGPSRARATTPGVRARNGCGSAARTRRGAASARTCRRLPSPRAGRVEHGGDAEERVPGDRGERRHVRRRPERDPIAGRDPVADSRVACARAARSSAA